MNRPLGTLFRRVAAIGDSVSQGCQNVGVSVRSQPFGLPSLIAKQAGAELPLPWIAEPGYPPHIDRPGVVLRARLDQPELMQGVRLEPTAHHRNFAVAGARLCDVTDLTTGNLQRLGRTQAVKRLTQLVLNPLGDPALDDLSQLDRAILEDPTLLFCWAGANDVIENLFYADLAATPPVVFERRWRRMIQRLLSETTAVVVTIGLPDIAVLPLLQVFKHKPRMLRRLVATLAAYNDIIRATADRHERLIYADLGPDMQQTAEHGVSTRDWDLPYRVTQGVLTFKPLRGGFGRVESGGLISYDSLHPTQLGYSLLANTVIRAMNQQLAIDLPQFELEQVARQDPLLNNPNRYSAWLTSLYLSIDCREGAAVLGNGPLPGTPGRWAIP